MTSATSPYLTSGHGAEPRPLPFDPSRASHVDEELMMSAANAVASVTRKITAGGVLLATAGLLLAALAGAMGIVSWHAQYAFIYAIKHQQIAATLEALGLDCGAVVFSVLGIALARLGRRAVIERVLVCVCAAGSCAMNAAGSDLGSPRSVAAFIMPPVLFAVVSDRLIAVIRRSALGRLDDAESQRSAWQTAGTAGLYLLRLIVAPPSTVVGARRALLNATPLPQAPELPAGPARAALPSAQPAAAPKQITGPRKRHRGGRTYGGKPTKTTRFMQAVVQDHGPLSAIPVDQVARVAAQVCQDTADSIGMDAGNARTVLRKAVLAAQNGGAHV